MEQHWFKGRACLGPGFRQRHILAGHIGDPPPVFLTPPHPTPTAPGVYKATFAGDKSCVSAQVAARSVYSAMSEISTIKGTAIKEPKPQVSTAQRKPEQGYWHLPAWTELRSKDPYGC